MYVPPRALSEGNYSTWNKVFDEIVTSTNLANSPEVAFVTVDEQGGTAYWCDYSSNQTLSIIGLDGSGYKSISYGQGYQEIIPTQSVNGKYFCAYSNIGVGTSYVVVIAEGKPIWTYTLTDFGTAIGAGMSFSGKYVVVTGPDATNDLAMRVAIFIGA
ncbi:MAG: hypothetical protein QXI37_03290 [Thermoprotei archaeon]